MPSYSSALLPTTNGLTLGSSALRWTLYAQDFDIAGTFTASSRLGIKNFEDIRFADQFTGANVTAQIDAALTDISSVGLVVVPSSMGAGNATAIASGKAILDLRSGAPKFFTNNSVSSAAWQLNNDGTVTSQGVKSVTANPASAGFIRAAKSDAFNFRNNANGADVNGLSLDGSDIVQVGGAAGAKTIGAMAISGAFTGVTNLSYSGVITSTVATGTAPFSVTSTTVVPNLNISTLTGVVISGAPTTGQVLTATGVATGTWSTPATAGLAGTVYLQGGQTTVSGSPITFQNVYSNQTIAANTLVAGDILEFYAVFGATNNDLSTTRSAQFQLVIDGQVVGSTANNVNALSSMAGRNYIDAKLLIANTGGAASEQIVSRTFINTTETFVAASTLTLDTTTSHTVNFQCQWGTAPGVSSSLITYLCQIRKIGS